MSDMTRADYAAAVLLAIGNRSTAEPIVAAGLHFRAINTGVNRMVRQFPEFFPEHQNRTWTIGPTVVAGTLDGDGVAYPGNRIELPANLDVIERLTRNDSAVDPGSWADVREQPVAMPINAAYVVGLTGGDSDARPSLAGRKDSDLVYWPTTTAGFECYFRLWGTSIEVPLTADAHKFTTAEKWDTAIIKMGASILCGFYPGKGERAKELMAEVAQEFGVGTSVMGRERARRTMRMTIAGMP